MVDGSAVDQAVASARLIMAEGGSVESAIRLMRELGLSQIQCVQAVMTLNQIGLDEAKRIVHFSETWADLRSTQEQMHEQLIREIEKET